MVYKYIELTEKGIYKSDVEIKNALKKNKIYKIEFVLYSVKRVNSKLEIISKKYDKYIFNSDSTFFYWGLIDNIPENYYFAIKSGYQKIKDDNIVQTYMDDKYFDIGDTFIKYNNIKIRVYDKERMLIELVRNKKNIPYDMYKEIVNNYRKIIESLNF